MAGKVLRLRRADACVQCGTVLSVAMEALWDAATRTVTCIPCTGTAAPPPPPPPPPPPAPPPPPPRPQQGSPGASAQAEYDERRRRYEEDLRQRWHRMSRRERRRHGQEPQHLRAWRRGAEGERKVATVLKQELGDRVVVMFDRSVPKTKGNVDIIAVAPSGVWVIDVKNYRGRIERRPFFALGRPEAKLYVNRRNQTKLVDGMGWQVNAVRAVIPEAAIPVTPVVCFVDARMWGFRRAFRVGTVVVVTHQKLPGFIGKPGSLSVDQVVQLTERLALALPPVST